jgi:toxin ParE1/3/4
MLLDSAGKDLESIYRYLMQSAGERIALQEIETLEAACDSLADNPERGSIPLELVRTGAVEYRQIISKSYRIIYQIADINVFIFAIVHGRRSIRDVLRLRNMI